MQITKTNVVSIASWLREIPGFQRWTDPSMTLFPTLGKFQLTPQFHHRLKENSNKNK